MAHIIAANYATLDEAEPAQRALEVLLGKDRVGVFHLNASGQHDMFPSGGDQDEDPGAKGAGGHAAGGAAVGAAVGIALGALIAPVAGPLGMAAGGAAGAYAGSLVGGVSGMERDPSKQYAGVPLRPGGVILNARTDGIDCETRVIEIMQSAGPRVIEQAEGEWTDGDWADFDPVSRPDVIYLQTPR